MLLQTRGLVGRWLHSDEGATGRYTLGAILGQGAYGTVKKAVRKADGAVFAIKHIDKTKLRDEDAEMLEAECAVLRQVGYMLFAMLRCRACACIVQWSTKSDADTKARF